jgi:two-component system response regulator NreC
MVDDHISVLIVDDHTIVRSGVRMLLEAETDIKVVGEALNGREALELAETLHPDIVLIDISMPEMDGLEATMQLKTRFPHINVLILTMHRSDDYFFEMLKAGASGYILKGAKTSELLDAVRIVQRGEIFLYPSMTQKLVQGYLQLADWENEGEPSLSPREKEIFRLLAAGYSNKEIAEKLVISPSTVHSHRGNLMEKLGLNNRHELIQYARKRGLVQN